MEQLVRALVLGIVEGVSAVLPISSAAHLIVLPEWLGWNDAFVTSAAYGAAIDAGVLLALVASLWTDLGRLLRALGSSLRQHRLRGEPDRRLAWLLLLAAAPSAAAGAFGGSTFERFFRVRSPVYVAVVLLVGAGLLWLAGRRGRGHRPLHRATLLDLVAMTASEAAVALPGLGRSGGSLAAGLASGLDREVAARISLLLAVPFMAGAAAWQGRHLLVGGRTAVDATLLAAGMLGAAFSGLLATAFLLAWLRRRGPGLFVAYRVAFAAAIFAVLLAR